MIRCASTMGPRLPTRSGDERDAVTRWPAKYLDQPGVRSWIKRGMRRRERHEVRAVLSEALDAMAEPVPLDSYAWDDDDNDEPLPQDWLETPFGWLGMTRQIESLHPAPLRTSLAEILP